MRKHLRHNAPTLAPTSTGSKTPARKRSSFYSPQTRRLLPQESAVLRTVADDLADALPELRPPPDDPPGTTVADEVALLVRDGTGTQAKQIRALAADDGDGPSLRRAWNRRYATAVCFPRAISTSSPWMLEHDVASRHEQHERLAVYLKWR